MQNPELDPNAAASPSGAESAAVPAADEATKDDVRFLLRFGGVENETDRALAIAAAKFVESPTDNLAEIDGHLKNLGDVETTYMMDGVDAPAEIDAVHADLLKLFCQHHINAARAELAKAEPDNTALDLAMRMALDSAKNLSKGYKIPSYQEEVEELQRRVAALRGS